MTDEQLVALMAAIIDASEPGSYADKVDRARILRATAADNFKDRGPIVPANPPTPAQLERIQLERDLMAAVARLAELAGWRDVGVVPAAHSWSMDLEIIAREIGPVAAAATRRIRGYIERLEEQPITDGARPAYPQEEIPE